jgi:hypothetical protein
LRVCRRRDTDAKQCPDQLRQLHLLIHESPSI